MDTRKLIILLALAGGLYLMNKHKKYIELPRGIRNHNPLNIRENSATDYDWEGERATDDDKSFEEFTNPVYGIRAGARILASYQRRGLITLEQIISTWAPATENDTESYISSMVQSTGLLPYSQVQPEHYPALFAAMIKHENGIQPYSMELIEAGVAMA